MEHFNWLGLSVPHHLIHVATFFLGSVVLILLGVLSFLKLKPSSENKNLILPSGSFSLNGLFELLTEFIDDLVVKITGEKNRSLTPIFSTVFLIVFFHNIVGLMPGMTPATENINTTLSMGLCSFILYNYFGFKAHGISYLKHFLGPIWFLAPMMLILEIISHLIRPLSLGLRLWGNMMGDHVVLGIFLDLAPYLFIPLLFYGLGLFVCFMQAFVFTILSIIYVGMAKDH